MSQPQKQQPGWYQATLDTPHGAARCFCHGPHPDEQAAIKAAKELGLATEETALVPDNDGTVWIVPR